MLPRVISALIAENVTNAVNVLDAQDTNVLTLKIAEDPIGFTTLRRHQITIRRPGNAIFHLLQITFSTNLGLKNQISLRWHKFQRI
jgi:hypothetical protein